MPPRPKPELTIPTLLPAGQTADLLDISATALRRIRPHIQTLELLPKDREAVRNPQRTFMYPLGYILAAKYMLRMNDQRGYEDPVERFSYTPAARFAIQMAEGDLALDIKEVFETKDVMSRTEMSTILHIGKSTINKWSDETDAPLFRQQNGHLGITEEGLGAIYAWRRPASVPQWPEPLPSIYAATTE